MAAHSPPEDDVVVACFRYTPATSRLERRIPAHREQLAGLRAELREWLDRHHTTGRYQRDVLLGIGEACTNAIEHAHHNTADGCVEIELSHHGDHLTARVRDNGQWRPEGQHKPHGGRGTSIMRAVANRYTRHTGPDGTTVTLTLPVHHRSELSQ